MGCAVRCGEQKIDPYAVNFVLDFLAHLFEKKIGLFNTRSAISVYHDLVDNMPIGQHPKVCTLMTKVFNRNPPNPKYVSTWDVK